MMLKYSLHIIHEKGFKMAYIMNKIAMINSGENILEMVFAKFIVKFRYTLYL